MTPAVSLGRFAGKTASDLDRGGNGVDRVGGGGEGGGGEGQMWLCFCDRDLKRLV